MSTPKIITHFTNILHLESIKRERMIYREFVKCYRKGFSAKGLPREISEQIDDIKKTFELVPRYVWFTEANDYNCAYIPKGMLVPLQFDANEINAERWSVVRKKFAHHQKKWQFVQSLEATARDAGEDPERYFVTSHPIKLSLIKNPEVLECDRSQEVQAIRAEFERRNIDIL